MRACSLHVKNGSNPQRARRAAPKAQEPGGKFRTNALRFSLRRTRASGRTTDARRDADPSPPSKARDVEDASSGRHSRSARVGMIVLDRDAMYIGVGEALDAPIV